MLNLQAVQKEVDEGTRAGRKTHEVLVAQDQDSRLAGADFKQSHRRGEVFLADMGKQSKRERASGVKSEAPDVEYEVVEGVQGHEERRDRGVLLWDKQQVRMWSIGGDRSVRHRVSESCGVFLCLFSCVAILIIRMMIISVSIVSVQSYTTSVICS